MMTMAKPSLRQLSKLTKIWVSKDSVSVSISLTSISSTPTSSRCWDGKTIVSMSVWLTKKWSNRWHAVGGHASTAKMAMVVTCDRSTVIPHDSTWYDIDDDDSVVVDCYDSNGCSDSVRVIKDDQDIGQLAHKYDYYNAAGSRRWWRQSCS